ncbi:MAG: DUF2202 domain-containing protein [Bacteroidales bacterium]|nr:DUF2202 domain-containing protein [Bacteroidales bacterium]
MKTKNYFSLLLGISFFIFLGASMMACNTENQPGDPDIKNAVMDELEMADQNYPCIKDLPAEPLSEEETAGLIFMREEEKLARDVYIYLYDLYSLPIFNNIPKSEQRHMDAIKVLLDKYKLEDPVAEDVPGTFKNQDLQALYDQLIEAGKASRVEALKVGALIEETDILDLQEQIDDKIDNKDITQVYTSLLNGSYNHLKAFTRVLKFNGVIYEPVLMEKEDFDSIVSDK